MHINYSEYSSIGGRSRNEDMVQITSYPESTVALVADGLGGHGDGDIASRLAVHVISQSLCDGAASRTLMERAIRNANERILMRHEMGSDMKTTIAVLWFNEDHVCAAHVGDTRIYQFRNRRIVYQSVDHSVSQIAVTLGEITAEEIRFHQDRNRLTRALGSRADVRIDIDMLDVQAGDAFLLCSDGFWELVWEREMLEDLSGTSNAEQWLTAMRRRVESRMASDSDNSTAAVFMIS
ncbi:MAG: PP2C family protein-serine/threonine phosphatase [Aristaeellaceae bacterium]